MPDGCISQTTDGIRNRTYLTPDFEPELRREPQVSQMALENGIEKVHRTHTVVCLSIVVWVLAKAETYSLQNSGFLLSGDSFALLNQERKRYIILCFG